MKTITLDDISKEDFDEAAAEVSSGIKAYNRKLDVRAGTVLRDLLVDPEAAVESVVTGQIGEVMASSSLKMMKERQDAGEEVDQNDVNSILSNFNITPTSGTPSHGLIKVVVSDRTVSYTVPEGAVFSTVDGLEFSADSLVVAASDSMPSLASTRTTKLYDGAAGYFFLVQVTATEPGAAGNITRGASITPGSSIFSFVMAEAYKDFDGGSDTQSLDSVIDSIPSGLSIRGFVNRTAVKGMLKDEFDDGNYPIVAVSSVGYGDIAQRRDKHNVFGVGVGGRVDVYVRNFGDLYTVTKSVIGSAEPEGAEGTYILDIPPGVFPGACWVKSVYDPFGGGSSSADDEEEETGVVPASLSVDSVVRTAPNLETWHDMLIKDGDASEAFNTVWQGFSITLNNVPAIDGEWSREREFKVTMYCLPQAEELQAYVDRGDVRNIATDVVVRCPIICNVSVNATVIYDPREPVDGDLAKTKIKSYINGLGFVGRLTRSEIVQILKNLGAVSVEMPEENMLWGALHDALGERHVLQGDALDVSTIEDGRAMLSKGTVIFAVEEPNIQIKLVPGS